MNGLHHIALIVSDASFLRFYECLGFSVKSRTPRPEHHDEIIMMEGNGLTLEIFVDGTHPPRVTGPEALGLRHFALRTADIEADMAALAAAGYPSETIRTAPDGKRFVFVKDPDGLPVELHE